MSDSPEPLPVGTRITGEYTVEKDDATGATVERITSGGGGNHAFFFLVSSFRPNHPGQLGFVTHRSGCPQICLFDFPTNSARVLTDHPGLLPYSPVFSHDGAQIHHTTRGGEVRSVAVETGKATTLAMLEDAGLGECALSADGNRMVVPFKRGPMHGLLLLDLAAGSSEVVLEQEMKIIHPQFHPTNVDQILFAGDPYPRLWTFDLRRGRSECLYRNGPDEFIVHESFLGNSEDLIFAVWPRQLARMNIHNRQMRTIARINAWHMRGHPGGDVIISDTAHPDRGLLLIDPDTGTHVVVCHPGASCKGTQWEKDHPAGAEVWAALREQGGKDLSWMEMKVDHVYGPQTTHPHPAFDHEGRRVSFTSDRSGAPEVYVVDTLPFQEMLKSMHL